MRAEERAVLGAAASPSDFQALLRATRNGAPFLFFRDGEHVLRLVTLDDERMAIGRAPGSKLEIAWDLRVSGVHAHLEQHGRQWVIEDDGLSRNGTFVNGERLRGQRTLRDGDLVQVGDTVMAFRDPLPGEVVATIAVPTVPAPHVSDAQRRVLVALCRPFRDAERFAIPATNQEIADELVLSLDAVKSHMRALFARFGVEELPPNEKRTRLVERALSGGAVRSEELE
ncbi:MAG TPA: FHA domain-containing protein [Solirubrobacteraceae bacterium]|nr:FHA domain-containing protein [Solirubrobacteraceae bacterium]